MIISWISGYLLEIHSVIAIICVLSTCLLMWTLLGNAVDDSSSDISAMWELSYCVPRPFLGWEMQSQKSIEGRAQLPNNTGKQIFFSFKQNPKQTKNNKNNNNKNELKETN